MHRGRTSPWPRLGHTCSPSDTPSAAQRSSAKGLTAPPYLSQRLSQSFFGFLNHVLWICPECPALPSRSLLLSGLILPEPPGCPHGRTQAAAPPLSVQSACGHGQCLRLPSCSLCGVLLQGAVRSHEGGDLCPCGSPVAGRPLRVRHSISARRTGCRGVQGKST